MESFEINIDKLIYYSPHQAVNKRGQIAITIRTDFDAESDQTNNFLEWLLAERSQLITKYLDVFIKFRLTQIMWKTGLKLLYIYCGGREIPVFTKCQINKYIT